MRRALPVAALLASLVLGACTSGASPAASTAAPSVAPSTAASGPASVEPSASADPCNKANLPLATPGRINIGTDNPAYPPYFDIPEGGASKPWALGDPTDGKGFESAFAYALVGKLGFAKEDVNWLVIPFDNSYAPGAKPFDLDINQVSYSAERAQAVDMSDGYYTLNQSVVALAANPLAKVTSISGMKDFKFGAQVGTTSLDAINNVIAPTAKAKVYSSNDDAIAALQAKQIDGLVVDLPTAFYVTGAQV